MVTRFHSPRTLSRPRSRNCRKPRAALMMPNTGAGVCLSKAYSFLPEPLAELRGRVNFGLIGSGFRETSYPVCGTSAASAYSHCKNAEGTDDVSQRDTFRN